MLKADDEHIYEWAKTLYNRGQYEEALKLAKKSVAKMEASARLTKPLELIASCELATEKFDAARADLQALINQHSERRRHEKLSFTWP